MFNKNHNGTETIKSGKTSKGIEVLLTRKTTKSGNIRHAVITYDGRKHMSMGSFHNIGEAFALYKTLVAL